MSLRLLIVVGFTALAVLVGCISAGPDAVPQPERWIGVGETAELDGGMLVTLDSFGTAVPAKMESTGPGTHWMVFEVRNATEATMSIPSRPAQPDVLDANGRALRLASSSVLLVEGGGGWGVSAAVVGGPYIDPGGRWRMAFEIEGVSSAAKPLRVDYSPGRGAAASFILR
jgi:hypothetical protein